MKKIIISFLVITTILLVSTRLIAGDYNVIKVYDGDTITAQSIDDGSIIKVRMYGIDAPEIAQKPYGAYSREYLKSLVLNKTVRLDIQNKDMYGRSVAKVYVKSSDHEFYVNLIMLSAGYAFYYYDYAKSDTDLKRAYELAVSNKLGIFSKGSTVTSPSAYRKAKRNKRYISRKKK